MGYGCGITSLGCELWMELKDHLNYFLTISQQCYISTTTGAHRSRSIQTSSSQLLKKEFRVVRCLQSIFAQTPWLWIRLLRDYHPKSFVNTLLIWLLYLLRICHFSGSLYFGCFSVVDTFYGYFMDNLWLFTAEIKCMVYFHSEYVQFDLTKE